MIYVEKIINANQTVWTIGELQLLLGIENPQKVSKILQQLKKKGLLFCPYRGIRCRKNFDKYELGAKIKKNSYISLQTVLQKEGIIFQDRSSTITLVSDNSLSKEVDDLHISICKIKKSILSNPLGIINTGTYQIASPERAVCDMLYLDPLFYFDHPDNLDIKKLKNYIHMYPKNTQKIILSLIDTIQHVD